MARRLGPLVRHPAPGRGSAQALRRRAPPYLRAEGIDVTEVNQPKQGSTPTPWQTGAVDAPEAAAPLTASTPSPERMSVDVAATTRSLLDNYSGR